MEVNPWSGGDTQLWDEALFSLCTTTVEPSAACWWEWSEELNCGGWCLATWQCHLALKARAVYKKQNKRELKDINQSNKHELDKSELPGSGVCLHLWLLCVCVCVRVHTHTHTLPFEMSIRQSPGDGTGCFPAASPRWTGSSSILSINLSPHLIGLREWRERHFINAVTGETQWFCTVVMLSLN